MTFGFIGAGNMGGAIARAVSGAVPPRSLFLSGRSSGRAESLAEELGAYASNNAEIAKNCDFIFLGVKPQMLGVLLEELRPLLAARKDGFTLVSMAAGVTIEKVRSLAGGDYPVIRIMPNTPAAVGEGMILYASTENVTAAVLAAFKDAMRFSGLLDELPEGLIDAGCAVSGCGPAFAYMFIEALADGGVEKGLPRAKAQLYAAQMLLGSAKLLIESGDNPGRLKDAVCSPGGSTIAGVHALEAGAFRGTVMEAVAAAYERTVELGK